MPTPTKNPDARRYGFLSADDLAQRYGVCRVTVFRWAAAGILPAGELVGPRTRRWRTDILERFEGRREACHVK